MRMTDLDEQVQKTWEDVEKLKSQIGNILQSLVTNKDLFEAGVDVNLPPKCQESMRGTSNKIMLPPLPTQSKPSNLVSKLSKKNKLPPTSEPRNDAGIRNDTRAPSSINATGSAAMVDDKMLQMRLPTYSYLESETFLLPLLDRWVWGTTINNTSKIAASFPELNLSIVEPLSSPKSPFSYSYTITLLDSEWKTKTGTGRTIPPVFDIPFQKSFGVNEKHNQSQIQPGCRATITATFEAAPLSTGNEVEILANLTLRGKFQWTQKINIQLMNLAVFKDDIYKRFQPQIFGAMSQCQNTLRLERRVRAQGLSSLSNAFRHFLTSLGFQSIHSVRTESHVSVDTYGCDVPALLFGAVVKIEEQDGDLTNSVRCSLSTRSLAQLHSLLSMLSARIQNDSGEGRNSLRGIRISSLSSPTATVEEKRLTLLAEIEVLIHLMVLENRNVLDSDLVVHNWIGAFLRVMEASDGAFRS